MSHPQNHDAADPGSVTSQAAPEIVVLNRDLFFGVNIGNTLRALGYQVRFAKTTEQLVDAVRIGGAAVALALVDLNAGVAWDQIAALTNDGGPACRCSSSAPTSTSRGDGRRRRPAWFAC